MGFLASSDAIGDGLRNGNLPTLAERAMRTCDEAAGARILFSFGGERVRRSFAREHRELIRMRDPFELHLGHGAVSILVDLATVAERHDNIRRRHAPVADAQTGALAPTTALHVVSARLRITDKLAIESLADRRGKLCSLSRGRDRYIRYRAEDGATPASLTCQAQQAPVDRDTSRPGCSQGSASRCSSLDFHGRRIP